MIVMMTMYDDDVVVGVVAAAVVVVVVVAVVVRVLVVVVVQIWSDLIRISLACPVWGKRNRKTKHMWGQWKQVERK
jgi:hypothetical protein